LLDLARRVFEHRQILVQGRANGRPARLAQFQCRIGVFVHENLLYGHLAGLIQGDDFGDAIEDLLQARRKVLRSHPDAAAGDITYTAWRDFQHAVAGDARTGIDSEYPSQCVCDN
jgi:hypothetical protein